MDDGTVPVGAVPGAVAGVCGVCWGDELVLGSGVWGTPEPGLGEAGLFCAQPKAAHISNKAIKAVGERCIEFFKTPGFQTSGSDIFWFQRSKDLNKSWMQAAATQMAGQIWN